MKQGRDQERDQTTARDSATFPPSNPKLEIPNSRQIRTTKFFVSNEKQHVRPRHDGDQRRIVREKKTVAAMMQVFCKAHHRSEQRLCQECADLLAYAECRLDRCPFAADKPTCAECPIHCYKPAMRDRIRAVMRFAGPRMMLRRPVLAIRHLLDQRKRRPT